MSKWQRRLSQVHKSLVLIDVCFFFLIEGVFDRIYLKSSANFFISNLQLIPSPDPQFVAMSLICCRDCTCTVKTTVGWVSSILDTIRVSIMRILHFMDASRVWVFDYYCFRYHSGLYIMQEPSYLGPTP